MLSPARLVQTLPLNSVQVALLSPSLGLKWTLRDHFNQEIIISPACSIVVWEIVRGKRARACCELFSITVKAIVIQVLGNTAIIHLDPQITVVLIVVANRGVFTNTIFCPGIRFGKTNHIWCTVHTQRCSNVLYAHINPMCNTR